MEHYSAPHPWGVFPHGDRRSLGGEGGVRTRIPLEQLWWADIAAGDAETAQAVRALQRDGINRVPIPVCPHENGFRVLGAAHWAQAAYLTDTSELLCLILQDGQGGDR